MKTKYCSKRGFTPLEKVKKFLYKSLFNNNSDINLDISNNLPTRIPRKLGILSLMGFTLIEMITVIILVGILTGVGVPLLANLTRSFQYSIGRKNLSESADVALRRMDREIRRLQNDTSVTTATNNTYSFTDIDGNTIQYALNGTTLERTLNGTTDGLADNVTSLTFTYYEDDGTTTIASPVVNPGATDIRLIEIDLTLSEGDNTIYYRTRIKPMNIIHLTDLFA